MNKIYYSRLKRRIWRKQVFWIEFGMLALLLVACGEPSAVPSSTPVPATPAAPSATNQPTTARVVAPASPAVTTVAIPTPTALSQPTVTPEPTTAAASGPANPPNPPPLTLLATSAPTPANSPTPSPQVPTAATQHQIGSANCCQAFAFAGDGRLYFYDKDPRPASYMLDPNSNQRQQLSSRFGTFSQDLSLVAVSDRSNNVTTIEQVNDGKRLATLQNRASQTLISPDKSKIAYLLRGLNQAAEAPQSFELWTGNIDGSKLRVPWTLTEGANLAWFPDNRRLLLTARDAANQRFGLWVVDTEAAPGQAATLIVESKGLIAANLSSDGSKVVYAVTLQGAANSGIWLANSDGSNRHKFDWIGGWRWSPANPNELFYIPTRTATEKGNNLWSYDVATGKATSLVNPATLSFQIALDEWEISPDDKNLAYRNAADNTVWLLRFRP